MCDVRALVFRSLPFKVPFYIAAYEKANPSRGGGAKPRASSRKRRPGYRKEQHSGIIRIFLLKYFGALSSP